jgi:O-antigen/teichoic acid export membrane protein
MTSIKKLAVRGAIWTIAGYGASQLIRLVSNPILAGFLDPSLLGLNSIVSVFSLGLSLFADVGLGPCIIQSKRGEEPDFYNTAWTMQIIRGFLLWMACIAIAWPVFSLYSTKPHAELLIVLLPVVGFTMFVGSFESLSGHILHRQMQNARINMFGLVNQVINTSTVLVWASITRDVWSLVLSGVFTQAIRTVMSHRLLPNIKHRIMWEPSAAREIFSFGKWIFLSTATTFLADQIDRLMLGRLTSFEVLGVYGVAFAFADVPRQLLVAISGQVLFPAFSKMTDLPREEFRHRVLKNRLPMLLSMGVALAFFVCFGDVLIAGLRDSSGTPLFGFRGLYRSNYADAAWILPILALGLWPRMLTETIDKLFYALGKPQFPTYGYFSKFLFMLVAMPLGFHVAGLLGCMIVIAVNDLPYYIAIGLGLQRERLSCYRQDLQTTLVFVSAVLILGAGRWFLGFGLSIGSLFPHGT